MSIEDKLEQVAGALEANTEILQKLYDLKVGDVPGDVDAAKKRVAEAEQAMHEEPAPKPVSKKKASKKKAAKKTKPSVTIEQVKAELSAIDRESARAVLSSFGIKKLSDLQPEDFEAAITEAKAYAEDDDLLG